MSNILPTVKERILQIVDYKGYKKEKFFEKIGMTYGNFTGSSKKTPINSTALSNILLEIPDVSAEWLLTGKEPMLKNNQTNNMSAKPLIPIEAMAGFGTGEMTITEHDIKDWYVVPDFNSFDFMIKVKGSSMYPKYSSGDVVACKKLPMSGLFFQWNKVYVLDTIQGPLIKRIKKGSDKDHVLIVSENERYEPFELHIKEINSVALVLGVIRLE